MLLFSIFYIIYRFIENEPAFGCPILGILFQKETKRKYI